MKRSIIFLSILLNTIHCFSQQIILFEPSILEIEYNKRMITDTLNREKKYQTDYLRLRIGKNISMFYSPKDLWYDSLSCNKKMKLQVFMEYSKSNGKIKSPGGVFKERIYKNYPKGLVSVFNHFDLAHWTYTEYWEIPQWELQNLTKKILNYPCQLAISKYRGRIWYAWFTFDIPISEGPWKLCGLPGLILEAYDEKKDYHYIATGLSKSNIPDVGIYNYSEYDWFKTDRIRYLKTWYKALNTNMGAKVTQTFNIQQNKDSSTKMESKNYDLEERDFHDEK